MPGQQRLIILDACRSGSETEGNSTEKNKGLAPINVPRDTIITFSARDGDVAFDSFNGSDHSPFVSALIKNIDINEDISLVMRKVKDDVWKSTNGLQEPCNMLWC